MTRRSYRGQSRQDEFVLNVLKNKENGIFLEIGSNHPSTINNTFILEDKYNWTGIMVEYSDQWLPEYKSTRSSSIHIIEDATCIDYKNIFEINNIPYDIDYLSFDLEVSNGSTIRTLEKIDKEVMDIYKFAVITFEHDVYNQHPSTRKKSRDIFSRRGYTCVFEDINNKGSNPYEDWYVHSDLVDMEYINDLKDNNEGSYKRGVRGSDHVDRSINWQDIKYQ